MTAVECSACGAANGPAARFCGECGAPVGRSTACAACGAPDQDRRFCSECGAPRDAPAPPVRSVERKTTSVLFGDLVGFTPLSEARDAEEVRALLSRYFLVARGVVERYGGTVEKFIGDAVMAVWGAPVVHEDDAERAVRAGLDLVAAVAGLEEDVGAPGLAMRVGVVTGEVAVTLGAVGEGMVAGDAVNTAARVQSAAPSGRVWVDAETRRRASAAVSFADAGQHALKGKAGPVALAEAVGVVAGVGGAARLDGLVAPLTGRDRELLLVKETFAASMEDHRPRLLLLTGAAGSGKSRLGWEFESFVDGLSATVWWHRGRCRSYGEGTGFGALAEALRGRLDIEQDADRLAVDAALAAGLDRWVPDAARRARLTPALATLLGGSAARPDLPRDDLFGAWLAFLEALSGSAGDGLDPVVLLVEDVHHAGAGLLDLLVDAVDAARFPLVVVAVGRPEVLEARPDLGNGRRRTSVWLEPLTGAQMARLVDGLVDGLPAATRDALVARVEGLPLFAVETVRSLIDSDAVVPVEGRYRATPAATAALTGGAAPATLQALVAARIDDLPTGARDLLQDAAVLGLAFTLDGLAALGHTAGEVAEPLALLRRRDLVAADDGDRDPRPGHLRFVQSVVRAVAYETLSRADRRARHLAVAGHLAGVADPSGDLAPLVAAHLVDAVTSAPGPDDDALLDRARGLLDAASERAREIGALDQVVRLGERALAIGASDPARDADLHHRCGTAAGHMGREDDALAHLGAAVAGYEAAGDEAGAVLAGVRAVRMGVFARGYRDGAAALVPWFQRAVAATAAARTPGERSRAEVAEVSALGCVLLLAVYAEVERLPGLPSIGDLVVRAVPLAERHGTREAVDVPNLLGGWFAARGAPAFATALLDAGAAAAHRIGDPGRAVMPLLNSSLLKATHDLPGALALAEEAVAVAPAFDYQGRAESLVHTAALDWALGHWDQVGSRVADAPDMGFGGAGAKGWSLARSVADARGRDLPPDGPDPGALRSEVGLDVRLWTAVACAPGADDTAGAVVSTLAEWAAVVDQGDDTWYAWPTVVDRFLAAGDHARAATVLELYAERDGAPAPLTAGLVSWFDGELARADGDTAAAAEPALRRAVEVLDGLGASWWAARARWTLAEVLRADGRADEAGLQALAARAVFTALDARPWVERCDRVAAPA